MARRTQAQTRVITAATLALSLAACTGEGSDIRYDHSADVPSRGWTTSDTLFFPITISPTPDTRSPLYVDTDYRLACSIRMDASYAYTSLPLMLILQQTDTIGSPDGSPYVSRNLLRHALTIPLRDDRGYPVSSSWGSLFQHEVPIDSLTLRFDTVGTYRMLVFPATHSNARLDGITSVGLSLHEVQAMPDGRK